VSESVSVYTAWPKKISHCECEVTNQSTQRNAMRLGLSYATLISLYSTSVSLFIYLHLFV